MKDNISVIIICKLIALYLFYMSLRLIFSLEWSNLMANVNTETVLQVLIQFISIIVFMISAYLIWKSVIRYQEVTYDSMGLENIIFATIGLYLVLMTIMKFPELLLNIYNEVVRLKLKYSDFKFSRISGYYYRSLLILLFKFVFGMSMIIGSRGWYKLFLRFRGR